MITASCFDEQVKRIYLATGARTQLELASLLDMRQSFVSDVLRRKRIPLDWLSGLMSVRRINPEWILTGKGQQFFAGPADGEGDSAAVARQMAEATETVRHLPLKVLIEELGRRVAAAEAPPR